MTLILVVESVSKSYLSHFTFIRKLLKVKRESALRNFLLNDDRENTLMVNSDFFFHPIVLHT